MGYTTKLMPNNGTTPGVPSGSGMEAWSGRICWIGGKVPWMMEGIVGVDVLLHCCAFFRGWIRVLPLLDQVSTG
jgi:hypothetical protein